MNSTVDGEFTKTQVDAMVITLKRYLKSDERTKRKKLGRQGKCQMDEVKVFEDSWSQSYAVRTGQGESEEGSD